MEPSARVTSITRQGGRDGRGSRGAAAGHGAACAHRVRAVPGVVGSATVRARRRRDGIAGLAQPDRPGPCARSARQRIERSTADGETARRPVCMPQRHGQVGPLEAPRNLTLCSAPAQGDRPGGRMDAGFPESGSRAGTRVGTQILGAEKPCKECRISASLSAVPSAVKLNLGPPALAPSVCSFRPWTSVPR